MAITPGDVTYTFARAALFGADGTYATIGWFIDGSRLYFLYSTDGNQGSILTWKMVDLIEGTVSSWVVSSTVRPRRGDVGPSLDFGNIAYYVPAENTVYLFDSFQGDGIYGGVLVKVNLSNGLVTYANKRFRASTATHAYYGGASPSHVKGIVIYNGHMYVLSGPGAGADDLHWLQKYDLSGLTFSTTVPTAANNYVLSSFGGLRPYLHATANSSTTATRVTALLMAADNTLLVIYPHSDKVEKYALDGTYIGVTNYTDSAPVNGFGKSGGQLWRFYGSASPNVVVQSVNDLSTGVLSPARSSILLEPRACYIGELSGFTIEARLRDDWGLPLTSAVGQNVRVTFLTQRGPYPDNDDAALSLTPDEESFRPGGVPVRTLLLPIGPNGVATFYLQSARIGLAEVSDTISVEYPVT